MLNYEFPPMGGGAATANLEILKQLTKKEEIEIDLITSSESSFRIEKFSPNITIHYLDIKKKGIPQYQKDKDLLNYSWKSLIYCKKLIKQKDFNLVHAFFGIPCGFIAMLLGKPYIVSLRGTDVPFYNERYKIPDSLIFKWLSPIIWKRAKEVIANSQGLRDLALKTKYQPISVIPNGVDIKRFTPKETNNDQLKIICTDRLIERKCHKYLIEATKDLPVTITFVGDGPLRTFLEKLSNKHKFLGRQPRERIPELLQEHDLYVLPSLNEGMSNSLLEAMATGLPIITTDTGGSKELIKNNGFIIPKKDSEAIKEKVNLFIQNPALSKTMGINSRLIAEQMSWENVANQYIETYKKCAE